MHTNCEDKKRYTEDEATKAVIAMDHDVKKYKCQECGWFHLTDGRQKTKPYRRYGRRLNDFLQPGQWNPDDLYSEVSDV